MKWGKSKKETFTFLINRMTNQAQSRKCKLLSHVCKEMLIKYVIQVIPSLS
ncbi:hypothetical protein LINPERHAP2_LOCUS42206 [Linum perenne]